MQFHLDGFRKGDIAVASADLKAWGVMDVLALADFPDIRFNSIVHSATEGNLLVIPGSPINSTMFPVLQQRHQSLDIGDLPSILRPAKGRTA